MREPVSRKFGGQSRHKIASDITVNLPRSTSRHSSLTSALLLAQLEGLCFNGLTTAIERALLFSFVSGTGASAINYFPLLFKPTLDHSPSKQNRTHPAAPQAAPFSFCRSHGRLRHAGIQAAGRPDATYNFEGQSASIQDEAKHAVPQPHRPRGQVTQCRPAGTRDG